MYTFLFVANCKRITFFLLIWRRLRLPCSGATTWVVIWFPLRSGAMRRIKYCSVLPASLLIVPTKLQKPPFSTHTVDSGVYIFIYKDINYNKRNWMGNFNFFYNPISIGPMYGYNFSRIVLKGVLDTVYANFYIFNGAHVIKLNVSFFSWKERWIEIVLNAINTILTSRSSINSFPSLANAKSSRLIVTMLTVRFVSWVFLFDWKNSKNLQLSLRCKLNW